MKVYEKFSTLTTISILQIKCVILAHTLHSICNKLPRQQRRLLRTLAF